MTTRTMYADPMQALNSAVNRFDRRKKTQQTLLWLPRGLMAALLIGVGVAVAARMRPLLTNSQIAVFAAGVVVAAVVICLAVVWGRRKSAIALAQRFDIDFELQEKVSTALELNSGRIEAPDWLAAEQLSDAEATTAAALTNLNSRLPLKFVRRDWVMVILLGIAIALLLLLPNPQADALSRNAAVDAALAEAADTLEEVAEDVAADPSLDAAERQALLEDLRQRIEGLQNQEITAEEAFASLSEASAELQERSDELGSRSGASQAALERTAENLRQAGFGSEEGSGEPLEQVTEGLEQISEQASQMSESERQQAADALRDASQSMQNSQMTQSESQQQASESLQSAAEAMEQGDTQTAQEQLQQAQEQLQQGANEAQQQQQSQQNLSDAAQQAREAASQVSEAQQQQEQGTQSQQSQQSDQGQEGERGSPQQSDQAGQQQQNGQQTDAEGSQQSPDGQLSQMGMMSESESQSGQSDQGAPSDSNASQANAGDAAGTDGSDQQLQAAGEQQQVSQDNNADGQGEREFESVNVPRQVGGELGDEAIVLEADPSDSPVQEGNFSQNPEGNVSVPYNEVFGNYRDAANRALDSGYVPLALRDVVRDYFTSLEPGR